MFNLQRLRDEFTRSRSGGSRMPAAELVLELCSKLLVDIGPREREAVLQRLGRLRRADDLRDLRSALFGLVSLQFGEAVARARLDAFDAGMAALPARAAARRRDAWSATVS
jgi:hypothetical protein